MKREGKRSVNAAAKKKETNCDIKNDKNKTEKANQEK